MTPGHILAGKYRLISLIGRGGMGSVWRAERITWGSLVAVKIMDRVSATRPDVLARFQQEARLAANLRSTHVVQVLDDGRDDGGVPFIVMELLVGETLAERLARVGRLSPTETATIVTHVARALAIAHELQMIHRDLKPDNLFLIANDDEVTTKVLDFGIAKWNAETFPIDAPTTTGAAIGTPSYMSPEQIQDSKRVDHRTDLWSLAVIAAECLTGRHIFEADNLLSLALQICNEPPRMPSSLGSVPVGFDGWFERATARHPNQRFQSARELADELRRVCGAPAPASSNTVASPGPLPHAGKAAFVATLPLELGRPAPQSTEGLTHTQHQSVVPLRKGQTRRTRVTLAAAAVCASLGIGLALRANPTLPGATAASIESPPLPLRPASPSPAAATAPLPASVPAYAAAPAATIAQPTPSTAASARSKPSATGASPASERRPASAEEPTSPAPVSPAPPTATDPDAGAVAPSSPLEPAAKRFDRDAAKRELGKAAEHAANCRPPGGPRGRGRVQLRFEPSGKVAAAWILTPQFDDTTTASCILMIFRRATIPAFEGPPELVVKTFEIQ